MSSPRHSASHLGLLGLLILSASCSEQFQKDGAPCPASVCSDHGVCAFKDTYPTCTCAEGYLGAVCSRCAEGFHRSPSDLCVADEACAPGQCGPNGTCSVTSGGTATCACALGYGGEQCDACRAGFHAEADGGCALDQQCLSTSCALGGTCSVDAGRVLCACDEGRSGAYCEQRTGSCAANNPCSAHGSCVDQGGVVRCACSLGYAGATCSTCYPGYVATDAGCVAGGACSPATCGFVGACAVDGGATTCACPAGYEGDACERCATGFHRTPDLTCVADETCQAARCGANGTCRVQGGVTVCDCAAGSAGASCEACAPGFHAEASDAGSTCALDTTCRPETCRFHGACAQDGGVTTCACAPGFSGAHCETNVDDCVNSACNGAACVDLLSSNVCLCDGGVYAQVCP